MFDTRITHKLCTDFDAISYASMPLRLGKTDGDYIAKVIVNKINRKISCRADHHDIRPSYHQGTRDSKVFQPPWGIFSPTL